MKVSELIKELKKLPKDAEVYLCKDWEIFDEEGYLTDLYRLSEVTDQYYYADMGMDFKEIHDIILVFENERAHATINKNW